MWLCYKVMATRPPPCVSESQVRGLDVGAELENYLVRNWEVSGCVAIWQQQEHRPWRARHGPSGKGGCTSLPQRARAAPGSPLGHCQRAASQTKQSSKSLFSCKICWFGFKWFFSALGQAWLVPAVSPQGQDSALGAGRAVGWVQGRVVQPWLLTF